MLTVPTQPHASTDHAPTSADVSVVTVPESAPRVVLVRHGQTDFNIQGRFQGVTDIPLNAVGLDQAQAAGKVLAQRIVALSSGSDWMVRVVSSPLQRAVQTAQALVDHLRGRHVNVSVGEDHRLIERSYGKFEGLNVEQLTQQFPEEFDRWRHDGDVSGAQIEPAQQVGRRFADSVMANIEGMRACDTLVLVSHGAATLRGIETLLGLDPATFHGLGGLENCHWSELGRDPKYGMWRLTAHNMGADASSPRPLGRVLERGMQGSWPRRD